MGRGNVGHVCKKRARELILIQWGIIEDSRLGNDINLKQVFEKKFVYI